ncbi:HAD family hydrolase [Psychroserpens jangbogonensis]|uniref:HAD family hydrolase n=1 Tax=Psychroserpens jangbogonensis TaxID=1484460 RepID=UPI00053E1006|nr:HAD-IA family hydrolase [Psychroserpens jangbogonensis]
MFKAVLFDMDGVIVDTEPLHHSAYHQMFNDVNIDVSDDLYASFTGQSTFSICEQLVSHFNLPLSPHTLVDIKRDRFKYLFDNDKSLALIDGVLEIIKDYHSNGMTLVIASSASMDNINRIFKRFDLDQFFKAKISGADLEASKPHPEIFIKAAELAEHEPNECFVIEDSSNGVIAAKAAEIYCIAFDSPHSVGQDYSKADTIIESFSEISYTNLEGLLSEVN